MNSLTNTILVKHTHRETENGSFQGMGRKEKIGSHRSKGTTMQQLRMMRSPDLIQHRASNSCAQKFAM